MCCAVTCCAVLCHAVPCRAVLYAMLNPSDVLLSLAWCCVQPHAISLSFAWLLCWKAPHCMALLSIALLSTASDEKTKLAFMMMHAELCAGGGHAKAQFCRVSRSAQSPGGPTEACRGQGSSGSPEGQALAQQPSWDLSAGCGGILPPVRAHTSSHQPHSGIQHSNLPSSKVIALRCPYLLRSEDRF